MLESLVKINKVKSYKDIDSKDMWLEYLYSTREKNYNINNIKALSELTNKSVLNYVKKSLEILQEEDIDDKLSFYVEETLKWMEVAKCGSKKIRNIWTKNGFDLFVHNIGSSQIYKKYSNNYNKIVELLIRTHGLIGQYAKGEVNLIKNIELYSLIENKIFTKEELKTILTILNKCIIGGVSLEIWNKVKSNIENIIGKIINNDFDEEDYYNRKYIVDRFLNLRPNTSKEEKELLNELLKDNDFKEKIVYLFKNFELWYIDSALQSFGIDEILKMFYIISIELQDKTNCEHLSFENIMKTMYIDYHGIKTPNIYKKRIIESYLKNLTYENIRNNNIENEHLSINLEFINKTVLFNIDFSIAAAKLIEFCEIAYGTSSIFNKAVFMLYDLFNFRRDEYDRFYNEIDYLKTMNESLSKKAKILDYINGNNILDIGPGGGALMDMIADRFKNANVYGIDISTNVIEELNRKKIEEKKRWNIVKGDALELSNYFKAGQIDTIIYSSIIHELFSYIPFNGKKFNHETIKKALQESYSILPIGGRIIIRDGIMTENKKEKRIIRFKNKEDINILNRYCIDFKGRKVLYELLKEDEVMMNVNDAMEFLYTYTWGEDSYSLEVKEQFGYFTPNEYIKFIKEIFNNKCKIIESIHFLQDGYEGHLLEKITFYDEKHNITRLPDSTCIMVIEKI